MFRNLHRIVVVFDVLIVSCHALKFNTSTNVRKADWHAQLLSIVMKYKKTITEDKQGQMRALDAVHFEPGKAYVALFRHKTKRTFTQCHFIDETLAKTNYEKFMKSKTAEKWEFQVCKWYPNEKEQNYDQVRSAAVERCDEKVMRLCDIVPTDNPVRGRREADGKLYTLWEARNNKNPLSQFYCPSTTSDELIQLKQNDLLNKLEVLTFGLEAEIKKIGPLGVKTSSTTRAIPHDDIYGQTLLTFEEKGKTIGRVEAEGANGVKDVFVELVSEPLDMSGSARDDSEAKMALMLSAVDLKTSTSLAELTTITKEDSVKFKQVSKNGVDTNGKSPAFKDYVKSSSITMVPAIVKLKNKQISNEALIFKGTAQGTLFSAVCQANFYIPLSKVSTTLFEAFNTKQKDFKNMQEAAIKLAAKINDDGDGSLTSEDVEDLSGIFTIHLWNYYQISTMDTREDTKKDSWVVLPKTPVMDLVRGLSDAAKTKLLTWIRAS